MSLEELASMPAAETEIATEDGVTAAVAQDRYGLEILEVRDASRQLVFTYSPATKVTRLHVPVGDLELDVPEGAIRLRGGRGVDIETPSLVATAARGRLVFDDASIVTKKLAIASEHLVTTAGLIETHAVQILERARDVYREAEGLAQTKAGRVRVLAESTLHTLAGRILLRSRGDVKVDGERIDIG